jgi:uncharacterized protein (TIGR00297 family)
MLTDELVIAIVVIMLSVAARFAKLLTIGGAFAAALIGLVTEFIGGYPALGLLAAFFVTSNLFGRWRRQAKKCLGYEKGGVRDHWQVLANGGPAMLGLIIGELLRSHGFPSYSTLVLFSAGLAEANADTWATEIGSVSNSLTWSIVTGKPVARGQSGGISLPGTAAAAAGSMFIAFCYYYATGVHGHQRLMFVIGLAGFCGAMVDSVLGGTIQAQFLDRTGRTLETKTGDSNLLRGFTWLRNDAVNFLAGCSSLLIALLTLIKQ